MQEHETSYLSRLKRNSRKYWVGLMTGTAIAATGISIETIGYRSDALGIISIVGGVACMASVLPVRRLDDANELIETYREIRALPETPDFTEES